MNYLFGEQYDDFLKAWANERIADQVAWSDWKATAIGVMQNGAIMAVAVYSHFSPWPKGGGSMFVHIAADSPKWAIPGVVADLLSIPFEQNGVHRLNAITARRNKAARKLLRGLGFKEEGTLHQALPGRKDAVIYGLTLWNWRKSKFYGLWRKQRVDPEHRSEPIDPAAGETEPDQPVHAVR